jgi:succinate dehydrogenase (ubiquinone) cytochrome b560 subunit
LAEQRKNRPVSPHLSIYRPQITWYGSALNRVTGSLLSGSLYVFATAYLVAPLFGWHLESQSIAAAFATWPVAAKVATKYFVSLPFTYHCWNGVRHLVWDMGKELLNKQVVRTGWAVVGLSVASSIALALI